jgi:hypothetical protein
VTALAALQVVELVAGLTLAAGVVDLARTGRR